LIQEAYPTYMANAGVGTPVFNWPLGAYLEGRLVGAVPGTQSNFVQNGLIKYELPPTLTFDVTLTSKEWRLGAGALTASLKLSDLLDTSMAQPGYGGIDYPGTGRTVMMRLDYGW
jgi:hypothetical protein